MILRRRDHWKVLSTIKYEDLEGKDSNINLIDAFSMDREFPDLVAVKYDETTPFNVDPTIDEICSYFKDTLNSENSSKIWDIANANHMDYGFLCEGV